MSPGTFRFNQAARFFLSAARPPRPDNSSQNPAGRGTGFVGGIGVEDKLKDREYMVLAAAKQVPEHVPASAKASAGIE
jgi:hypothetical protein